MGLEQKRVRNWRLIAAIGILLIMFVGLLVYTFVPSLLAYEKLAIWRFVGWTSNSAGQVRQTTFIFINNGTKRLTINNFWVNGTSLDSTEWMDTGLTLGSPGSVDVSIVPKIFAFVKGVSYNFTVGTTSGSHYSFILKCDDASVSPENLTIINWDFVPYAGQDFPAYIGFRYRNYGRTPIIITSVELNGSPASTNLPLPQWTWHYSRGGGTDPLDSVIIDYDWKPGKTYIIDIRTAVGNTYRIVDTAPTEG